MCRFLALTVAASILVGAAASPLRAEERGREYRGYRGEYQEREHRRVGTGPGSPGLPPAAYAAPPAYRQQQPFGYVPPPAFSNAAPLGWGWR